MRLEEDDIVCSRFVSLQEVGKGGFSPIGRGSILYLTFQFLDSPGSSGAHNLLRFWMFVGVLLACVY